MKAIRIHANGGREMLRCEDVPLPDPGQGQVRVKIAAAGINFIDVYQREGQYQGQLPFTLGNEAAGTVDAVGPGVAEFRPGDRVAYCSEIGSYAEYAVVPEWRLVPVPANVDLQQAATVMLQGMTAHYLAISTYPLGERDTALVHAAAGGVGQLLVQIAKMRGAVVIGTVSTEEKAQLAREAGADHVIRYTEQDFEVETRQIMNGRGLDVVYDSVGKTTFDQSLNVLRVRGCLVLYGQSSGPVPPFNPQILNAKGGLFLTRPSLGHYTQDRQELLWRSGDLFRWIGEGTLKVRIDRTWPLAQAAEAQEYLENRGSKGKLLLIP